MMCPGARGRASALRLPGFVRAHTRVKAAEATPALGCHI